MAKTRTEKIDSIQEEIAQLENKRKQLIQEQKQQDRKDRTKRLCRRMGLFESLLPDTIPLSEEQFKAFLEKTVTTEHTRRILDGLTAQNTATATLQATETAGQGRPYHHRRNCRHSAEERHRRGSERGQVERAKLTADRNRLDQRYVSLKDEVKEAEQIRKSVYSILRQEQREQQPRRAQDMEL